MNYWKKFSAFYTLYQAIKGSDFIVKNIKNSFEKYSILMSIYVTL